MSPFRAVRAVMKVSDIFPSGLYAIEMIMLSSICLFVYVCVCAIYSFIYQQYDECNLS